MCLHYYESFVSDIFRKDLIGPWEILAETSKVFSSEDFSLSKQCQAAILTGGSQSAISVCLIYYLFQFQKNLSTGIDCLSCRGPMPLC